MLAYPLFFDAFTICGISVIGLVRLCLLGGEMSI